MIIRVVENKIKVCLMKVKSAVQVTSVEHDTSKAMNKLIIHF